jgi:FixJ family two-component response regulator
VAAPTASVRLVPTRAASLSHIAQLTERLARLEAERVSAVHTAIEAGARWKEIAAALGISTQAAHQRYRDRRSDPETGLVWSEPPLPLPRP